jgi:pantoate--beta-alanine ligase
MTIFRDPAEWTPRPGVGFVPTMGALHAGHIALVERARVECAVVVASVFVNPTQFNNPEDFATYPVTFDQDCRMLEDAGCDFVFAPTYPLLYPDDYTLRITGMELTRVLEGEHRPGHFDGMLTVVLKLLQIVRAERAYFGEKDYQQLLLVQKLVEAFFVPTQIVPCPTVREPDGLAMSSRNRRLDPAQRSLAAQWARLLADRTKDCTEVKARLEELGFTVDYVEERWGRRLGAVHMPPLNGGPVVRLIDNIAL